MKIHLTTAATQDRRRLAQFLVQHSPRAAMRAADAIIAGVSRLRETPLAGVLVGDGVRELYIRFGDSGYVVQYRVDADVVIVARIFHMRETRTD